MTQIHYLSRSYTHAADGTPYDGPVARTYAAGVATDRAADRRALTSAPIPPTYVDHEALPVECLTGWGDSVGGIAGPHLAVWTVPDPDGVAMQAGEDGRICAYRRTGSDRYPAEDPAWAEAFVRVVAVIRGEHARARAERPDVARACAEHDAMLSRIDAESRAHEARWAEDRARIARMFRRKIVSVEEQTVPGLCVVRSSRGRTLGYAHVWDGRWLGRISRV